MSISKNTPPLFLIKTDKDTHFTGAIAQHSHEFESLTLPAGCHELWIDQVAIISDQPLDWDVCFWEGTTPASTDLDLDKYIGIVNFPSTSLKQLDSATYPQYRGDDTNVGITYLVPEDGLLHVSLANRNATAKNAGATGEVVVKIWARAVR